jgi:hypothetical protein
MVKVIFGGGTGFFLPPKKPHPNMPRARMLKKRYLPHLGRELVLQ